MDPSDTPQRLLIGAGTLLLLCLDAEPDAGYEDLARFAGVEIRTVSRILGQLEAAGYLSRRGRGRGMRCTLHRDASIRTRHVNGTVGGLLSALRDGSVDAGASRQQATAGPKVR
jgi:DNA-binding IclR family transcriptional regulator